VAFSNFGTKPTYGLQENEGAKMSFLRTKTATRTTATTTTPRRTPWTQISQQHQQRKQQLLAV
jgi:ribosomal protein L24E